LVPTPGGTLPVWSDKTYITGWTIGTDFIPYKTYVYYWYAYGHQQSTFYGLGLQPGKGTYDDAQCTCLYSFAGEPSKDYTDIPQYKFTGGQWTPLCCEEPIPGLGVPRPDWVAAVNGEIAASITGNPAFGCKPGETLNLIRCPFQRGPDEQALFWVWFTAGQAGVLFTEANFVKSTDHSLQLIDYTLFERNATWINPSNFNDPCPKLPRCPSSRALARRPSERRVLGPRGVGGARLPARADARQDAPTYRWSPAEQQFAYKALDSAHRGASPFGPHWTLTRRAYRSSAAWARCRRHSVCGQNQARGLVPPRCLAFVRTSGLAGFRRRTCYAVQ
jgi:hypothetical protein